MERIDFQSQSMSNKFVENTKYICCCPHFEKLLSQQQIAFLPWGTAVPSRRHVPQWLWHTSSTRMGLSGDYGCLMGRWVCLYLIRIRCNMSITTWESAASRKCWLAVKLRRSLMIWWKAPLECFSKSPCFGNGEGPEILIGCHNSTFKTQVQPYMRRSSTS